jgi:hypothetical protein
VAGTKRFAILTRRNTAFPNLRKKLLSLAYKFDGQTKTYEKTKQFKAETTEEPT